MKKIFTEKDNKTVELVKIEHRGKEVILINNLPFKEVDKIKTLEGRRFSATHKAWYIPYTIKAFHDFNQLKIPYAYVNNANEFIEVKIFEDRDHSYSGSIDNAKSKDENSFLIGTASHSPQSSDNADIDSTTDESQSIEPSNGDSKDIDIHLTKGGREVTFNGGLFLIKIYYNEEDVKFLKSLRGYWNSKQKKWIVKGLASNLKALQERYSFWNDESYMKIHEMIELVHNPYLVTLYNLPDDKMNVAVSIQGYKSNIVVIQQVSERAYQKDNKRWTIPNEKIIIDELVKRYTQDGATIINRLKQENVNYHTEKLSYGLYKSKLLAKTEPQLKEIICAYVDVLMVRRLSLSTFNTYISNFIKFIKFVGISDLVNVDNTHIKSYLSKLSGQNVSESAMNNAVSALKFYYQNVAQNASIEVQKIDRPKKSKRLPTVLSLEEVNRLLEATSNLKHTTILYTLYSSGMRLNEILSLRVEDMWWDRGQIMVRGGKGKKDRITPFGNALKEILYLYFEEYKPIYWLFEGQDKLHQYSSSSVTKVVRKAAKDANIYKNVTPHTLRHCFATHLLDGGTDVRFIQALLGHKDIKTTMIYTHVTTANVKQIGSPLDNLIKEKAKKSGSLH